MHFITENAGAMSSREVQNLPIRPNATESAWKRGLNTMTLTDYILAFSTSMKWQVKEMLPVYSSISV